MKEVKKYVLHSFEVEGELIRYELLNERTNSKIVCTSRRPEEEVRKGIGLALGRLNKKPKLGKSFTKK